MGPSCPELKKEARDYATYGQFVEHHQSALLSSSFLGACASALQRRLHACYATARSFGWGRHNGFVGWAINEKHSKKQVNNLPSQFLNDFGYFFFDCRPKRRLSALELSRMAKLETSRCRPETQEHRKT